MRVRLIPAMPLLAAVGAGATCLLVALLLGVSVTTTSWAAAAWTLLLSFAVAADYRITRHAWSRSALQMTRALPAALAVGVKRDIVLHIDGLGDEPWHIALYDHSDPSLRTLGLPTRLLIGARQRVSYTYQVTPTRRGEVSFAPADVRVRSRFGLCELLEKLGQAGTRRVYPDFAQVARYAWLAGDRRLAEIGIKTYQRRGSGTDFKQLAEYRVGDPVRWIDWKATLRFGKPIVREFQDARDQCVMLLVDCGRRMRADDRQSGRGGSGIGLSRLGKAHFDQVLNAVMLLSYVALKQGDEVGAMTFGTPAEGAKSFPPRKGVPALNLLMGELYAVQPTPTHSDYIAAARNFLARHNKRSLVVIITNFRDEDSSELGTALRLLRTRHLVMLASLREGITRELASQPLTSTESAVEIASAHLFEQSRRDAFNRLAAHDALMVDAEPERLGIELVNRYQAAKGAGLI
jgi:uncharacterized protein (DUF58 family)